jgi:phosphoribosylformylglycinamidine synthase subunit PurS
LAEYRTLRRPYEKSLISGVLFGWTKGDAVARVVVDVMLKPEILDSQGQTIARKLPQLGFGGITSVRQGKRFEIELAGEADEDALEQVRKIAETLLANPVIETFDMRVE